VPPELRTEASSRPICDDELAYAMKKATTRMIVLGRRTTRFTGLPFLTEAAMRGRSASRRPSAARPSMLLAAVLPAKKRKNEDARKRAEGA